MPSACSGWVGSPSTAELRVEVRGRLRFKNGEELGGLGVGSEASDGGEWKKLGMVPCGGSQGSREGWAMRLEVAGAILLETAPLLIPPGQRSVHSSVSGPWGHSRA